MHNKINTKWLSLCWLSCLPASQFATNPSLRLIDHIGIFTLFGNIHKGRPIFLRIHMYYKVDDQCVQKVKKKMFVLKVLGIACNILGHGKWYPTKRCFCQFPFRWIYYYDGSNKSNGKETGKMHLWIALRNLWDWKNFHVLLTLRIEPNLTHKSGSFGFIK